MSIEKRWTETKGTVGRIMPDLVVGAYRQVIRQYGLNKSRVDIAISALIGIALWEFAGQATPAIVFVGLSDTLVAWQGLIASGEYWRHVQASGSAFVVGYAAAVSIGLAVGLMMVLSDSIRTVVSPWVDALYATPRLAIAPLILVWLGIGFNSKVVIIWLTAVFPMIINTQTGFDNVDDSLKQVARSFGASQPRMFLTVLLPGALPYIIAGARLATIRSIIGVVVAEFLGARAGIGYLIFQSAGQFRIAEMLVGILTVAGAGIVLVRVVYMIQYRAAPWLKYTELEGE